MLVFGETVEEHDRNLEKVLAVMQNYGLTENVEKRIERVERVNFLGYEISCNTIRPNVNRAQGIIDYMRPKSKRGLQRFLGLINYDRMFLKNITVETRPLYKLLEKNVGFKWDEDCEKAFQDIKKNWGKNLLLQIADFNKPFELETDASNTGIGGVLRQENGAIAYVSRSLNKTEQRYSITEKEVLAALFCMEKFRFY